MANIVQNFQLWLRGLLGSHDVSPEDVKTQVQAILEHKAGYNKAAADAMASTTTAADYFYVATRDVELVEAKLVSAATAAANGTNFATVIVNKHDGLGGAGTVAAQGDTTATSIAAGVPFTIAPSATVANRQLSAGQVLSFQITKGGSGVVVPAGNVSLTLRYL